MKDTGLAARLRQATVADLEVILHQKRSMFADIGTGDESMRDAMTAVARPLIEAGLKDGSYRGWLIEVYGRVVAGGGLAIVGFQPNPLDLMPRRAFIVNMYTEPAFRRQGLARLVLERAIACCREEGFGSVFLHAAEAGRALYESLGFRLANEMRLLLSE
ncbi:MAG TPA: GNAT family N-acetyltransferase [Vicinamibacteria bacterium]|nr:GNAT family N-acetyltransferase [Vicinamibacteria bacterium]